MVKLLSKLEPRSVSTSFYHLRDRGWLKKMPDGVYDLGPNAPPRSKAKAKPKANPKPAAKKKTSKPKVLPAFLPERSSANGKGDEA